MLFRMCIAVGLAVGLPAFSWSQQNEAMQREWMRQQQKAARQQGMMQQGFQQAGQQTEITGKIQSVAKGGLVVLDGANQTWRIAVLPATTVHVTGKTTAASLRSGAIVEFTAELDDKGAIRDKVASLTVTSLSEEKRMGIFPAGAAAGGGAFEGFGAGAGAGGEETPFGKPAKPAKRPAGKPASHALPAGEYRIVGRLIVGHGGALSVQTGRAALPFELQEQAPIEVDLADWSWAHPGCQATVKAVAFPARPGANQPLMAQGYDVQVQLPEPGAVPDLPKSVLKKPLKRGKKSGDDNLPDLDKPARE